jgi:hypothetical protein
MPTIHFPRAYRHYTGDVDLYQSNAATLTALFDELTEVYPSLIGTVFSIDRRPLPFVRVADQDQLIATEDYAVKELAPNTNVALINAVAGG